MTRRKDPVPDLYARAFNRVDSVHARLSEFRLRVSKASAAPLAPACTPVRPLTHEEVDDDDEEDVTVECFPGSGKRGTLTEWSRTLARLNALV